MQFIPIFLTLLAYLGWGVGDVVSIKIFRSNDPGKVTFLSGLSRMIIWVALMPFFFQGFQNITLTPLLFNLLAGLSSGLGYYFFGKAAALINPSIVAAISGGWGGSALIFSLVFFKEQLTLAQWVSIALIFLGLFLTTFNLRLFQKVNLADKGIFYAILAFIVWGICGAFLKIPAVSYGWYWTSIIMLIPYLLILKLSTNNIKLTQFKIKNFGLFLLMVVLIVLADLGYNGSFQFGGDIALVGTIAGSYSTLSTFLAYLVYREPLTLKQKIGIIISLLGIVATAYFSSVKT